MIFFNVTFVCFYQFFRLLINLGLCYVTLPVYLSVLYTDRLDLNINMLICV